MSKHILKSQMEVAEKRADRIAVACRKEQDAEEWRSRLDPAAYICNRSGEPGARIWTAEGPCGQVFRFTRSGDTIGCMSHTGGFYTLTVIDPATDWIACSCRAAEKAPCKHRSAYLAVKQAARMMRQLA